MAEKFYRVRTNVLEDKVVKVNIGQDVDFIEVLSLTLDQKDNYKLHTSEYGIIVGRVLANDAFGIPNCKVSVFVPLEDDDKSNNILNHLYPYTSVSSKNSDNIRYNLLPDDSDDDCYRVVGTFPNKRLVLDNDTEIEIFEKYWKYTTVTNQAGDYMIYGVPTGTQSVHVDLDLSDIGVLSQRPRDFMYKGYSSTQFDSPTQFKESTNLNNLSQIITQESTVNVYPFWGDDTLNDIAITRCDVQVQYKFEPTCVFFGGAITDTSSNSINQKCTAAKKSGQNSELVTNDGTIEMIRKTLDGYVEEYSIEANQLIDSDGVWCYQIPMNLDYIGTDEFGNLIKTNDPSKGIPTRTSVRFRFTLTESGDEGISRHRARYLVPNNPELVDGVNTPMISSGAEFDKYYAFGSSTPDNCFRDLYWNKVYSVKSYIPRLQTSKKKKTRNYSALRTTNYSNNSNPIPFNKIRLRLPFNYRLLCVINKVIINLIAWINKSFICLLDKLKIWKWYPFKIPCITFSFIGDEDDDSETTAYVPGCSCSRGQKYAKCPDDEKTCKKVWSKGDIIDLVEQRLGDEYEIANLDFYNDWLNGALYFPLWFWKKTNKKKYLFGLFSIKAKNKFCDCEKRFKKLRVVQSCAMPMKNISQALSKGLLLNTKEKVGKSTTSWHKVFTKLKIGHGIVKEVENKDGLKVYYYTPGAVMSDTYSSIDNAINYIRLYSTDIILLGSLNDCSLDGLPNLYANLPTTTANIPMMASVFESNTTETDEDDDEEETSSTSTTLESNEVEDGTIETSGMDWTRSGDSDGYYKGLFFDLGCSKATTRIKTCINVERVCELGMSLDATYTNYTSDRKQLLEDEYEADGLITRHELVDNDARAMFASMNGNGLVEKAYSENTEYKTYKLDYSYPVDLDGKFGTLSQSYTKSRAHITYDNFDKNYVKFRLGENIHFYDETFILYDNSFYFYFGLNQGSTSLDKFYSKFYADCKKLDTNPFNFTYKIENARYCTSTANTLTDYGSIVVYITKIKTPYSYELQDEFGETIIAEDGLEGSILAFGIDGDENGYKYDDDGNFVKEGRLWYQNPESYDSDTFDNDERFLTLEDSEGNVGYYYLENGTYTLKITDARGKSAEKTIKLRPSYISMDCSASGLGMKYYGYDRVSTTSTETEFQEHTFNDTDGQSGEIASDEKTYYSTIDSEDYGYGNSGITIDYNDDTEYTEEDGSGETIINEYIEAQEYSYVSETISSETAVNSSAANIDEKTLICGSNKSGTIIINSIIIDDNEYEVLYIGTQRPTENIDLYLTTYDDNGNIVRTKKTIYAWGYDEDDVYEDGDFFLIVSDNSKETPSGEYLGYVKLSITPQNYESFSACSCDFDDETKTYDLGYNLPSGKNGDYYGSYSSPTSGGIYEYGDLDVRDADAAHINFSVWVPDDYEIRLIQYCNKTLSDNQSIDVVTVENGKIFDLMLFDVPIRFLLGEANEENQYNADFFHHRERRGDEYFNEIEHPGNLKGWFNIHLPWSYTFPEATSKNYERWSEFVALSASDGETLDDYSLAQIIMYKFDCMFRMSNGAYVSNESLTNMATTSNGGQKPILYIGAYPNYSDIDDLSTFLVDTIGSTDILEEYPNIVGSNYCYKVEGKTNDKPKYVTPNGGVMKSNKKKVATKYFTGNLYNGLNPRYCGADSAFFNPQYLGHDKTSYVFLSELSGSTKIIGNYFAGFTLNAGLTNTDYNGKCGYSEEYSSRTESYPMSADSFTMCAGNEVSYENGKLPNSIVQHYFRAETVDRRLDYDLFAYMPQYTENGINLGKMWGEDENIRHTSKYGRMYGTVYNGIEMAYDGATWKEGENYGTSKYNVIGSTLEDGLEYYYFLDQGDVVAVKNNPNTSKNKRFYSSYIKCGSKKFDITNMYYSSYHVPDNVVSMKDLKEELVSGSTLIPLSLDGKPTSDFYYKNEVNHDFGYDDYPTKRTFNVFGIKPTNKLTFEVTSCSYDMESGILGTEESNDSNTAYQSSDNTTVDNPSSDDSTVKERDHRNSSYIITAETKAGETVDAIMDTRDKITVYHEFSESDLETSWDSYEIRYRTVNYMKNPIELEEEGATSYSETDYILLANFSSPKDIRLRYKITDDGYNDTHSTYTERPMLINMLGVNHHTWQSLEYNKKGELKYSEIITNYGNEVYPLDGALNNSVSPSDIVDNIRISCRGQFLSIGKMPETLASKNEKDASSYIPLSGKYQNCFLTQTNYNRFPFNVESDNQNCEIAYDDASDSKSVIYNYGVYSYKRKGKTKTASDWDDFFRYGRGIRRRKKKYYYHQNVASVVGIASQRNYIYNGEDNLGKNMSLIKISNVLDLRPFFIQFRGSSSYNIDQWYISFVFNEEVYTSASAFQEKYKFIKTSENKYIYCDTSSTVIYFDSEDAANEMASDISSDDTGHFGESGEQEQYVVSSSETIKGYYYSDPSKQEIIERYGGGGGITIDVYVPFDDMSYFSLFKYDKDKNNVSAYTMDDCNIEYARLCINKEPKFIGSKVSMSIFSGGTKPYREDDNEPIPSVTSYTTCIGVTLKFEWPENSETGVQEINKSFKSKTGNGVALILKMKSGYYYTTLFKLGYNDDRGVFRGWT